MFYNWFLGCKFLDSSLTLQRLCSDFFVWTSLTLQPLDSGVLRTQSINIFSFKILTILLESSSHLSCTCCWFPKLYFQVETSTLNMSKIHLMSMFCLPRLPPPSKSFRSSQLVANSLFHMLWIIECLHLIYPFLSQGSTKTICSKLSSRFTCFITILF